MDSILFILNEIEDDCVRLKRGGWLTEYGEGQLDLVKILKKAFFKKKEESVKDSSK